MAEIYNDEEINKEKKFKHKCLKNASSIYLWYPLLMVILTVVIIYCLVQSQTNTTKSHVDRIVDIIKNDTTKYKLDSLTNHRLITLEINQNSYSNNIAFYSIFISAIITIVILIIGFSIYLNNKENVKKIEKEQNKLNEDIKLFNIAQNDLNKKHDYEQKKLDENIKSVRKIQEESNENLKKLESQVATTENIINTLNDKQIILDNSIGSMKTDQQDFKTFIEKSEEEIQKIVNEQKYLHFEIFDSLYSLQLQRYKSPILSKDNVNRIVTLTNAWTFFQIRCDNVQQGKELLNMVEKEKNDLLNLLENEIKNLSQIDNNTNFTKEAKQVIIGNLRDSLKFIRDTSLNSCIQSIIDKFEEFKPYNQTQNQE